MWMIGLLLGVCTKGAGALDFRVVNERLVKRKRLVNEYESD